MSVFSESKEEREKRWKAYREKRKAKEDKKIPNEKPKAVKDYLGALKVFDSALSFAIRAKGQGMFAPEAERFIMRRHLKIISLMDDFHRVTNNAARMGDEKKERRE